MPLGNILFRNYKVDENNPLFSQKLQIVTFSLSILCREKDEYFYPSVPYAFDLGSLNEKSICCALWSSSQYSKSRVRESAFTIEIAASQRQQKASSNKVEKKKNSPEEMWQFLAFTFESLGQICNGVLEFEYTPELQLIK